MSTPPSVYPSCSVPNDVQRSGLPLIHGERLRLSFQAKTRIVAVDGLTFGIPEGRITAIIGESGSGKSTVLKLIYGLLEPEAGEVRYRGWRVPTRRDKLIPGHDAMRMVSQGFDDLNTYANVWDNVASQLSNTDLDAKTGKTAAILERLRIAHLAKQRVVELSGGEKQRTAIARALVTGPEVLLMDEPFNQVDASFREKLQQDIMGIVADTGLTIVLVSHDPAEVLSLADGLIVLKGGRIVAAGQPASLYEQPPNAYTARLIAKSNILDAAEAASLGLKGDSPLAVHPEWLDLRGPDDAAFEVTDVRFKGFYEELSLRRGALRLSAINLAVGRFPLGSEVGVSVSRHHALAATDH